MSKAEEIKKNILELTKEYYKETYKDNSSFKAGERISYAGRIYDENEMCNLIDSSLEFWLTAGRYSAEFENKLANYLGVRYCYLVNSGSSANLIAFFTLTSPLLKERRIRRGDEVITVAAGFPTTIAPIVQYGGVPVFVDVTIPECNIDINLLESALTTKTKAVMLAHTLGNPFDIEKVKKFCDDNQLWLIEDNCDALGSEYLFNGKAIKTGTIGDIGTSSFYPPHHITMGEGGAVYTNNPLLARIMKSMRDWGRDCFCDPGQDNSCKHRFDKQFGELPLGYDHKYVYSHFGFNLKATDMQAAIGCAQLDKIDNFIMERCQNWQYLKDKLSKYEDVFILPRETTNSTPSWFGFLIFVRESAGFSRGEIVEYLENSNIQTRNLFAGNIIKHPCFDLMRECGEGYRVVGTMENTDLVMNNAFWIGVYPGMTIEKLDYMILRISEFIEERT